MFAHQDHNTDFQLAQPVGRLAPSPTGAQHLGNARTFLLAWLSIRFQKGSLILRVEDLDTPRIKPWATQQALDDLRWLGLDWDLGPDHTLPTHFPSLVQTCRLNRYQEILNTLHDRGYLYSCTCTRREIEEAASAPHELALDGPVYPGTCATRSIAEQQAIVNSPAPFAWRFRMPDEIITWHDGFLGPQSLHARQALGDFVVGRVNATPAYQLAVVVDDHDMNIQEVVRGDDLIASTYRQLAIYRALDWSPPRFIHVPLVVGPDGRRLAKRHGDTRLSQLRFAGIRPEAIIGYLAFTAGLQSDNRAIAASELIGKSPFSALSRQPVVIPFSDAVEFFRRTS